MLITPVENKYDQLMFQKFSWENKLKILNGGKDKIKYDIDQIKEIPIKNVLHLLGIDHKAKKFKVRNEKTPSCYFTEDKNLWIDYGTGEGGSVIDLYMKINNCSFKEAIKELNNLI